MCAMSSSLLSWFYAGKFPTIKKLKQKMGGGLRPRPSHALHMHIIVRSESDDTAAANDVQCIYGCDSPSCRTKT